MTCKIFCISTYNYINVMIGSYGIDIIIIVNTGMPLLHTKVY